MALSLYRKYRPEVFEDVVGQEHVEKTLMNAIAEGTVAQAYLFCGPRGTGKTTTARLLAKALLCENGPSANPDGTCAQCSEIAQGVHPDVNELDAASRTGVDNVREEIIGRVNFAPTRGRAKIYIIDEVHMLSTAAFNALLKTLEEPPEHIIFILCTTDPQKVPETIQSRCQRFDFRRFSIDEIVGYLERICKGEGYTYEPEALEFIAAKSTGGMRDATTALEQVGVYTSGQITLDEAMRMLGQIDLTALFEIAGHIARRDTASCFIWIDQLVGKGVDLAQFARDLSVHLRNLYVAALTGGADGIIACTTAQLEQYRQQAQEFGGTQRLARALDVCGSLVAELRNSPDARLSVEIAMTRLCRPESDLTLDALAERIEALERGAVARLASQPTQMQNTAQPVPEAHLESAHEEIRRETQSFQRADAQKPEGQPEPVSQPEPDPAPEPARGEMSPARLLAALLTVIRRDDVATAAFFEGVSLERENDGYHLLFPAGSDFPMRLASSSDARALVGKAFEEVLGRSVNFDYRLVSLASSVATPSHAEFAGEQPADDAYFDALASSQGVSAPMDNVADMFADDEPNFDAPLDEARNTPLDDETAANIADALSAFGKGVKVHEIDSDQ